MHVKTINKDQASKLVVRLEEDLKEGYFNNYGETKRVIESIIRKLYKLVNVINAPQLSDTDIVHLLANDYIQDHTFKLPSWYLQSSSRESIYTH